MDTMRYMFTVLYIACGVLHHVYALDTSQWQCHRQNFGGAVITCTYPCVTHSTMAGQQVIFVTEQDGTPCMNGYCLSGLCKTDEIHHHALKRKKRSLKHYLVGFFLGRRVGLRQGSRRSLFQRFGRR
uniref:Basic tail secreted protein n=1 Tax=Rhipicephalus appendiculatus TaxID=34631 RepID=A0A131YPS7_RHIAP